MTTLQGLEHRPRPYLACNERITIMNRREFLGTGGVAAATAVAAPVDLSLQCRKDFPRGMNETYFNSAAQHPLGNHCAAGRSDERRVGQEGRSRRCADHA